MIALLDCNRCGCCGHHYYDPERAYIWCGNCADHVLGGVAPWDATWRAQTGRACPYGGAV